LPPIAAVVATLLFASSPSYARPWHDTPSSGGTEFSIDVAERGVACVVVPPSGYDLGACAGVTGPWPEAALQQMQDGMKVVAAEVVRAGDWAYEVDILREARARTSVLYDWREADAVAAGFVAQMQRTMSALGVRVRHEGLTELSRTGGVQIVTFDVAASVPPDSPMAKVDHAVIALVIAAGFTYTVELRGPAAHAEELQEITRATLRTLRTVPPPPSPVYRAGMAAVRLTAIAFCLAMVAALTILYRRRGRS
jgi:hypothetical protein